MKQVFALVAVFAVVHSLPYSKEENEVGYGHKSEDYEKHEYDEKNGDYDKVKAGYGKDDHGKEDYGKDKHGEDDYGKDKHGKDDYGKDNYGKDSHGDDSYDVEYKQGVAYNKQYVYHGKFTGDCAKDGFYYKDAGSFVICSNNNAYEQPCAPGSRNSGLHNYNYGDNYYYRDFCDINLVDYGYGVKTHGYNGPHHGNYGNYGNSDGYYGDRDGFFGDRNAFYGGRDGYYGGRDGFYGRGHFSREVYGYNRFNKKY